MAKQLSDDWKTQTACSALADKRVSHVVKSIVGQTGAFSQAIAGLFQIVVARLGRQLTRDNIGVIN